MSVTGENQDVEKLKSLATAITETLTTFSCELVTSDKDKSGGSYVKVRNCLSNTFNFSSSLFAVVRPVRVRRGRREAMKLTLAVFTYNEEELESESVAWETAAVCSLLTDKLSVGNYTFCCGIVEENLVKMDLRFFEIKDTLFEKFGAKAVFRSRKCSRVFNRGLWTMGRGCEAASLCPCCRAWVQAIMDRMLQEDTTEPLQDTNSTLGTCPEVPVGQRAAIELKTNSTTAVTQVVEDLELVCLDGEVEQELERMQGAGVGLPLPPPATKSRGRTVHPCPHPGCQFVGRSTTVLRYHMPRHTGEALFCCTTCGRKFKHKKELSMCEKRHQGRYDHACGNCDKKFISKKKLDLHMRVHTGEKPFSCPLCSHRCARQDNLNCHTRKQHGVSWREAEKITGLSHRNNDTVEKVVVSSAILASVITSSGSCT